MIESRTALQAIPLAALTFLAACGNQDPPRSGDGKSSSTSAPPAASGAPTSGPPASPTTAVSGSPATGTAAPAGPVDPATLDPMVSVPAAKIGALEIPAFQIDKTEVTVGSYDKCVKAGACSAAPSDYKCNGMDKTPKDVFGGGADHPRNCVSNEQAESYCKWAGKTLPTGQQWKYAALGWPEKKHPWGNAEPVIGPASDKLVCGLGASGSPSFTTCKVGTRPEGASPFGALDMAGNVMEWLKKSDKPGDYATGSCNCSAENDDENKPKWYDIRELTIIITVKTKQLSQLGFRCVK